MRGQFPKPLFAAASVKERFDIGRRKQRFKSSLYLLGTYPRLCVSFYIVVKFVNGQFCISSALCLSEKNKNIRSSCPLYLSACVQSMESNSLRS